MPRPPLRFLSPLHKAVQQLSVLLGEAMAGLGLQNQEAHVLSFLLSYEPVAVGRLVAALERRGSTLTSVLDRLEEKGFVTRRLNEGDRRSFLLELTARGRRTAREVRRHLDAVEEQVGACLSQRDIAGFQRVMSAIESLMPVPAGKDA